MSHGVAHADPKRGVEDAPRLGNAARNIAIAGAPGGTAMLINRQRIRTVAAAALQLHRFHPHLRRRLLHPFPRRRRPRPRRRRPRPHRH